MNATEVTPRVVIKRDGKPLAIVDTQDEGFAWLLRHQGQSVHHATTHEGYSIEDVTPWSTEEAEQHANTARNVFYGDSWHRSQRCKHATQIERMSCGPCALEGYEPQGGWEEGSSVRKDGPNYAGWARLYVEARRTIPAYWRDAFDRERHSDNPHYGLALERSILTFGVKFTDS